MLVHHFAAATTGTDWTSDLSNLALPGGLLSAFALVIITLIKARSTERVQLSGEQKEHMDRLTEERNAAVVEAAAANAALDEERERRRIAEDNLAAALRAQAALQEQVQLLSQKVEELNAKVDQLTKMSKQPLATDHEV